MAETITQIKGKTTAIWGAIPFLNLDKEDAVSYDIGASGETVGSLKSIVHILQDAGSVVSTVTIKVPKGANEINLVQAQRLTQIPFPLAIKDTGVKTAVVMASAICSAVEVSSNTGDTSKETVSFKFMGNLTLVGL